MTKKVYILKTVGITIPNYDRKDLKVGMSVSLDEKVGDKFAKRGFLVKANAAATKADKTNTALEKANKTLTEKLAVADKALESLNESASEEVKGLEGKVADLEKQLEEALKPTE